jgi:hypothetical protein
LAGSQFPAESISSSREQVQLPNPIQLAESTTVFRTRPILKIGSTVMRLKDIIASAHEGYVRNGGPGLHKNLYFKQREYYLAGKFRGTLLAKTCVLMGRKQEALDLLEDAYARHEPQVLVCLLDRELLTLNDEPRFRALIKKIHFPQTPQPAELPN